MATLWLWEHNTTEHNTVMQSLLTQTWLRQPTKVSTWPVNNFSRISEEIKFETQFAPGIHFNFKFWHAFAFCKLDLNQTDYDHFCFKSSIEISKRKAQFLCKSLFCSDTMLLISSESVQKMRKKTLSSWQKTSKSNGGPSQSINQHMHAHRYSFASWAINQSSTCSAVNLWLINKWCRFLNTVNQSQPKMVPDSLTIYVESKFAKTVSVLWLDV